jgi:hypothetical protein
VPCTPKILALLGALAHAPALAAVDAHGTATLAAGPGVDTNPRKEMGATAGPDGYLAATASARGALSLNQAHRFVGRVEAGVRKFASATSEDLLAGQIDAGYALQWNRFLVGAEASVRKRRTRGGDRDYTESSVDAILDASLRPEVSLRLSAGGRWFDYPPIAGYVTRGPLASALLRLTPSRRHSFSVQCALSSRDFDVAARRTALGDLAQVTRLDRLLSAQLVYAFRGPIAAQAGLALARVDSNSFGESTARARVFGAITARTPWKLIVTVQGALQIIHYPDGIFLGRDLLLTDDEAQSSIGGKVALPLSASADLEVRYSRYWVTLPRTEEAAPFVRQIGSAGVTLRF